MAAAGLLIAYCARPGQVDVTLSARGLGCSDLISQAARRVQELLAEYIYAEGETALEEVVVRMLSANHQTVATAESCTGGLLAARITDVPGASEVFRGGWITYSNEAKERWLGVAHETLANHGAVSEAAACGMAENARMAAGTDYALAVTGIAGPGGGTTSKPVGTVFIALAAGGKTRVVQQRNQFDRVTFKQVTTQQALELLRRELVTGGTSEISSARQPEQVAGAGKGTGAKD
jgi:nicotinamide-nucleotide amidase